MLRLPGQSRNTKATHRAVAACLLGLGLGLAQDFGTADLPVDLADAGTKILGALNKTPGAGSRNLGYSEGPACDAGGSLYFTEDNAGNQTGNIWKVTPGGQASNFYDGPGLPNGLEFDNQGKLFSAEKGGIATYDKTGGQSRALIPMIMTPALDAAKRLNDLSIASNGSMFFTNHSQGNQFFFRDASGKVTTYNQNDAVGVATPNGAEYIEEKKMLLVTGDGAKKVFRFDVKDDGTVTNRTDFVGRIAEPDGLTLDEKGNVYVASYGDGTLYVYGPDGGTGPNKDKPIGSIKVGAGAPGNVSNCVFGGADGKTLFITGNGGAYKVRMKVGGRARPGASTLQRARYRLSAPAAHAAAAGYALDGRRARARMPASPLFPWLPAR
jgi:gluconolactonase